MSTKLSELPLKTVYNDTDLVLISTDNGATFTSEKTTIADLRTALVGVQPKRYKALISQTGTDAPTAIVLENTLGGDIVWTRTGVGTYYGTLNGAFTENKTLTIATPSFYYEDKIFGFASNSVDKLTINNLNENGVVSDGFFASILIEVYE